MASPKEGFLTDEQREVMKIAAQNVEVLSSSPRSPTGLALLLPDHNNNKGGRQVAAGNPVRHVRRSHSGKVVRVKKVFEEVFKTPHDLSCMSGLRLKPQ